MKERVNYFSTIYFSFSFPVRKMEAIKLRQNVCLKNNNVDSEYTVRIESGKMDLFRNIAASDGTR